MLLPIKMLLSGLLEGFRLGGCKTWGRLSVYRLVSQYSGLGVQGFFLGSRAQGTAADVGVKTLNPKPQTLNPKP